MENNILSFLNDNLNNNHKSRNVNKPDNVYNNGTNAPIEPPKRIILKENECDNCNGNSSILSKSNNKEPNNVQADHNKLGNTTFKKEEKKNSENLHVFTSYSNANKRSEVGCKALFVKKNPNMFLENKKGEIMNNNPIVLVDKNTEEKKIK